MKMPRQSSFPVRALTLLEMTIVILVLLTLAGIGMYSSNKMNEWKLGREANETLRTIHSAQRMYLADNPTIPVAKITEANLIPYLPNVAQTTPMPTTFAEVLQPIKSLDGETLSYLVDRSPPKVAISGVEYDPSGSATDSLWDVGE